MPDSPSNGTKRFEDLQARVEKMDGKLDAHAETLATIKTLLQERPCVVHDAKIRELEMGQVRLTSGAQVSVAKVAGLAGIISAIVTAIGAFFMHR